MMYSRFFSILVRVLKYSTHISNESSCMYSDFPKYSFMFGTLDVLLKLYRYWYQSLWYRYGVLAGVVSSVMCAVGYGRPAWGGANSECSLDFGHERNMGFAASSLKVHRQQSQSPNKPETYQLTVPSSYMVTVLAMEERMPPGGVDGGSVCAACTEEWHCD
ncbi:hypothetical protein PTI98_004557 [Pleurotus ostreatus]|nr:hypothetical protein PTI98_004557 [Pleurotus ostreatus]